MSQSVTLSIPTTCTQPWSTMPPVSDGRYCAFCENVVHDFTQYSDAELVSWFAQHSGPTCGRLRDDQLNLPLYDHQPAAPTGIRSWVRWALALVLGWQTARAQNTAPARTMTPQTVAPGTRQAPTATPDSVLFYVRGQVLFSNREPAQVVVKKGNGSQTLSDVTGQFQLPIYASDQQSDSLLLHFNYRQQLRVSTKEERPPVIIILDPLGFNSGVRLPAGIPISVGGVQVSRPNEAKQNGKVPTKHR